MSVALPATTVVIPAAHLMAALVGERDELLRQIERAFPQSAITVRGNEISASGPDGGTVGRLFEELSQLLQRGEHVDAVVLARVIDMVRNDVSPSSVLTADIVRVGQAKPVRAKTAGQRRYVDAIAQHVITFALGPAGTGKSWLAVAMAVQALHAKSVNRIILTRPAVEAGERLGFLPGDLMAKIDPYLRPLYDALHDMVGAENAAKHLERGVVEVAPLAFMRGRTLNNSFIILDEAQNTTPEQMKMFLTRIGYGSKAVVTGDVTQTDLPPDRPSGLQHARRILQGIPGIAFCEFDERDVMRHPLVQEIIKAYERRSDGRRSPRRE